MWLCLKNSFLSVVADSTRKGVLVVRARKQSDIEAIVPMAEGNVIYTPESDYPFRIYIDQAKFAKIIQTEVESIRYPSFKDEASQHSHHRASFYERIWAMGLNMYQQIPSRYKKES